MSDELLKSLFDWITVILLFLTFVSGAGALIFGNRINAKQAEQLQKFDKDLTDAKIELGKQQERAASAERDAAEAKTIAGKAGEGTMKALNEQERLRHENLSLSIALEDEKLARLKIEEAAAWRRLSKVQKDEIGTRLKSFAGQLAILSYNLNDLEASTFGLDIALALQSGHWTVSDPQPILEMAEGPVPLGTIPPLENRGCYHEY